MNDLEFMLGGSEMGFDFGISKLTDAVAGGPQKRRRTREANRIAAAALAEAADLQKQAAAFEIQRTGKAPAPAVADEPAGLLARLTSRLQDQSPIGVNWWVVMAGAAVGAWAIAPGRLGLPAGAVAGAGVAWFAMRDAA